MDENNDAGRWISAISKKWKIAGVVIAALSCMAVGYLLMLGFYSLFPGTMPEFLKEKVGTSDTQVIRSMERTKEVSLLRLGITGIISQENKSHFFNMEILGTE